MQRPFPRAAAHPPSAITVWAFPSRLLESTPVSSPMELHSMAARRPAPPAPITTTSCSNAWISEMSSMSRFPVLVPGIEVADDAHGNQPHVDIGQHHPDQAGPGQTRPDQARPGRSTGKRSPLNSPTFWGFIVFRRICLYFGCIWPHLTVFGRIWPYFKYISPRSSKFERFLPAFGRIWPCLIVF